MMTKYPFFDLDQIRRVSISRVAACYAPLQKSGCRQLTECPWHSDSHPSLTLYESATENRCHCFACGQGGAVIDYVMAREQCDFKTAVELVASIGGILPESDFKPQPKPQPRPLPAKPAQPVSYVPMDWVAGLVSTENSLSRCLSQLFAPEQVAEVTRAYMLGKYSTNGYGDATLFPTIDTEGRVRNVKVQHYHTDPQSPRFAHSTPGLCRWIGKELARQGIVTTGDNFDISCLFGAHLLAGRPQAEVMLVESPKNAVVGALAVPQHVWVAAGSKSMLNATVLAALRGRRVMVYPDRDAIADWKACLEALRPDFCYWVSDFCETIAPADAPKFDIADYIISQKGFPTGFQ